VTGKELLMLSYLIDGNNLIGKINYLKKLGKKDKQATREKLVLMVDKYFRGSKNKAIVHFDGFPGDAIRANKIRIIYSEKKTADDTIRRDIELSDNPRNIVLVTSDHSLAEFARVCSSKVITSEEFASLIQKQGSNTEEERINSINIDEIKKLFGA